MEDKTLKVDFVQIPQDGPIDIRTIISMAFNKDATVDEIIDKYQQWLIIRGLTSANNNHVVISTCMYGLTKIEIWMDGIHGTESEFKIGKKISLQPFGYITFIER